MKKFTALLFLWFSVHFSLFSQHADFVKGEILVMIQNAEDQGNIELILKYKFNTDFVFGKQVSVPLNIWKIHFDHKVVSSQKVIAELKKQGLVIEAQVNHKIEKRAILPNDTDISSQWQYVNTGANGGVVDADLDADDAWDITTGGVNLAGDSIVACIIDDGADLTHPDWGNNIWVNHGEIAGNGLDDDGNGYIDDHQGWNMDNNSNDIAAGNFGGYHGSPVAGIIGAKGDNSIGVAGVNWDVKLMILVGGGDESDAISAYSYPLVMRKLYDQTNGAKGAYVVSTNASWGVDFGKAVDAPLWCAMYDSLGAYGILSAGATANANVNVDVDGDLPTQCPSDYLLAVTNVDKSDTKVSGAGYGLNSIDLGAFGSDAYTMEKGGTYGGFGGTSGASPHVAGAIALMHSTPCAEFSQLIEANPVLGAILIKKYILDGTDANSTLSGITVSGGRLNLHKALMEIQNRCGTFSCLEPMLVNSDSTKATQAWISWQSAPGASNFEVHYREKNAAVWKTENVSSASVMLDSLSLCQDYEIIIRTKCDTVNYSPFSDTLEITSSGCCEVPLNLSVGTKSETAATILWDSVYAPGTVYNLSYEELNAGNWTTVNNISSASYKITGLDTCTNYEVKVQSVCSAQTTAFSSPFTFNTEGCEACLNPNYCPSEGDQVIDEWIQEVILENIQNNSGSDGGYGDYTNISTTLFKDSSYVLSVSPGYSGSVYDEYFAVWIDFNQDTDFDDAGENIYLSTGPTTTTINVPVTVDPNAELGSTRMRISMKYNSAPTACEVSIPYGEVEDYCVKIDSVISSGQAELVDAEVLVFPNPAKEVVELHNLINGSKVMLRNILGQVVLEEQVFGSVLKLNIESLPLGIYLIQIESRDRRYLKRIVKTR